CGTYFNYCATCKQWRSHPKELLRPILIDESEDPAFQHHGLERYAAECGHDELVDQGVSIEVSDPNSPLFHHGYPLHHIFNVERGDPRPTGLNVISPGDR